MYEQKLLRTKKYLGKIVSLDRKKETTAVIDFSGSVKEVMSQLIARELIAHGFSFHATRNSLVLDTIEVHFPTAKISQEEKPVVLQINERYLYRGLVQDLLQYFHPEATEDKPGTYLASLLSDAGISLSGEEFVSLYRKIYLEQQ